MKNYANRFSLVDSSFKQTIAVFKFNTLALKSPLQHLAEVANSVEGSAINISLM